MSEPLPFDEWVVGVLKAAPIQTQSGRLFHLYSTILGMVQPGRLAGYFGPETAEARLAELQEKVRQLSVVAGESLPEGVGSGKEVSAKPALAGLPVRLDWQKAVGEGRRAWTINDGVEGKQAKLREACSRDGIDLDELLATVARWGKSEFAASEAARSLYGILFDRTRGAGFRRPRPN